MLFQKSYWVEATDEIDVVDLIHDLRLAVRESKLTDGLMTVYVPDGRGAILLAPEGTDKDRELLRFLRTWSQQKVEPPKWQYLSHLLGSTVTLPVEKGGITIHERSSIYMIDLTAEAKRREWRVALFSESPKEEGRRR